MTERIKELMHVVETAAVASFKMHELREILLWHVKTGGSPYNTICFLGLSTEVMDVFADMLILLAGGELDGAEGEELRLRQEAWAIGRDNGWMAMQYLPEPT